jgi:hypothetical protein
MAREPKRPIDYYGYKEWRRKQIAEGKRWRKN